MDFRVLNLTFSKLICSLKKYSSPIKLLHFLTGSPGRSCLGPLSCVFFSPALSVCAHDLCPTWGRSCTGSTLCASAVH